MEIPAISNPRPAQAVQVAEGAEVEQDLRGSDSATNIVNTLTVDNPRIRLRRAEAAGGFTSTGDNEIGAKIRAAA